MAPGGAGPRPWQDEAVASPRTRGSTKPPMFSSLWQRTAPTNPVTRTEAAQMGMVPSGTPSWVAMGERRLKNVSLILEWHPSMAGSDQLATKYHVAVTLAEGETLRHMMHSRHRALEGTYLALRDISGYVIDVYGEVPVGCALLEADSSAHQSLRFLNGEMYYTHSELR